MVFPCAGVACSYYLACAGYNELRVLASSSGGAKVDIKVFEESLCAGKMAGEVAM
jgi:uncharacterized protein (DUF885 family)